MSRPLSVFEFTMQVRELLEGSSLLQNLWISGEISNFKAHSSGHCYFTIKDSRASLKAVMWRSRAAFLKFKPQDGMKVLVRGSIGVYERDGVYQFYVDAIEPDGLGALYQAFEELKGKLEKEGLFSAERKRPLPKFPRTVAVITSPTGAAFRDILNVLQRRYPLAQVLLFPVAVQGPEAVPALVSALDRVCEHDDIDVVILGRGGGSIEDLWAFNDELVARAIARCPSPVVSAVGHETDFTIADFVADLRAPTPSAAAELVVPDIKALQQRLEELKLAMGKGLERKLISLRQYTDQLGLRLNANSPHNQLLLLKEQTKSLRQRLLVSIGLRITMQRGILAKHAASLEALSPLKVLARGYSVTKTNDNKVISSVSNIEVGANIVTQVLDGKIVSVITGKEFRDEI